MAFVNVQITGTIDGAITNRDGRFAFSTQHMGKCKLHASFIGYETARHTLHLTPGDTTIVRLILRPTLIQLDETIVTGSTYTTGEDETVTLSPLDVVTTPGASADIFRAFKTFPGVATVDDGAGLFVRGGDVSETVILLGTSHSRASLQIRIAHRWRLRHHLPLYGTGHGLFHRRISRTLWQCAFRCAVHWNPEHARAKKLHTQPGPRRRLSRPPPAPCVRQTRRTLHGQSQLYRSIVSRQPSQQHIHHHATRARRQPQSDLPILADWPPQILQL